MRRFVLLGICFCMTLGSTTSLLAQPMDDAMTAEEFLFEEIPMIISTGFFATKATKAPGYSTVITAEDIDKSASRTLGEIVGDMVPGMIQNAHESYGSIVGVRGVAIDNNSKTVVMHDGQDISHHSSFGYSNEFDLPLLGDIGKIEVVNGPGAIVHGSGAIGGFINMIPKNGTDNPGWFVNSEYGPVEEAYKVELGHGSNYGEGKDVFVYAGFYNASGVRGRNEWDFDTYHDPDTNTSGEQQIHALYDGITVRGGPDPSYKFSMVWNHDDFNLNAFFTEVNTYRNGPQGMYGSNRWWDISGSGGPTAQFYDPDVGFYIHEYPLFDHNGFKTATFGFRPKYTWNITDEDSLDLIFSATLLQHSMDILDEGDTGGDETVVRETQINKEGGKEASYQLKSIFKTTRDVPFVAGNSLAVGGSLGRREFEEGKQWIHDSLTNKRPNDDESETNTWHEYSIFAEDVIDITEKLLFSAGVRYDLINYSPFNRLPLSQDNTSHRFALAYEHNETSSAKLSYQEGFRVPDMGYYTYVDYFSNILVANGEQPLPDLQIEEMSSTELNLQKILPDFNLTIDLNAYYNEYTNTLHWHDYALDSSGALLSETTINNVANVWTDVNVPGGTEPAYWFGAMANAPGKFRSVGCELISKWEPNDTTEIKMSYGYSEPKQMDVFVNSSMGLATNNRGEWVRFPRHMVKLGATKELMDDKLTLHGAVLYSSGYSVSKSSSVLTIGYVNPAYSRHRTIVNLAAVYQFTDNFSMKLTVKNLFANERPRMTNYGDPNAGALGDERRYVYLSGKYEF